MVKRLVWTQELIDQFWDGVAETPLSTQLSFSSSTAAAIADIAQNFIEPNGYCLDFGGGNGELCEELIARGYRAGIFEPSLGRGQQANHRLEELPGFLGLNPTATDGYDAVFCLEVYEHVPDAVIPAFMLQLAELVRPGGLLILTTPNRENLDDNSVYCPVCDSYFHRWQHLRSVDPESLMTLLGDNGFRCRWLGLLGFEAPSSVSALARSGLRLPVWRRALRWLRDGLGLPLPGEPKQVLANERAVDITLGSQSNIVYVGERLSEGA